MITEEKINEKVNKFLEETRAKKTDDKYKLIPLSLLKPILVRGIRETNLEKIKASIETNGFNSARVLTVVKEKDKFLIADGCHRFFASKDLGLTALPCLVVEGDVYSLAIECNLIEGTFASIDLFDYLDITKKLRDEGFQQKKIAEKMGWSEGRIKQYSMVIRNIVTTVLDLVKKHQEGRVTEKDTVVTFKFTERWFRDSGLYKLPEKHQLQFMEKFIENKFSWNRKKVQKETAKYKQWQEFINIAKDELFLSEKLEMIIDLIEKNLIRTREQLYNKISDLNEKSASKLICGNPIKELLKINDGIIDLVVTETPLVLLEKICKTFLTKTKANAHLYFFTSWKVYPEFKEVIEKFFDVKNLILWNKGGDDSGDLEFTRENQHGLIIFATKGSRPLNKRLGDIIFVEDHSSKMFHPTQKPLDVIKNLFDTSLQDGDLVCDPFMASGSTIKALKEYSDNCNYIGIEPDKVMFEKARIFLEKK